MPISEADLAAALLARRQGDEAAYATALTEIARLVRSRVRCRLGWAVNDLEDLVQEVLLSVHVKRATWDEARPVMPWVNAIADHKAIDARSGSVAAKGGSSLRSITVEAVAESVASPEPEWNPVGLDLERALAGLPTREQEVVRGLTVQGRTVRGLASALGMKEATVRVALHRGLKRLALAAPRDPYEDRRPRPASRGGRAPNRATADPDRPRRAGERSYRLLRLRPFRGSEAGPAFGAGRSAGRFKFAFAASAAFAAAAYGLRAIRPEDRSSPLVFALPVLALLSVGVALELSLTPRAVWPSAALGTAPLSCLGLLAVVSLLPIAARLQALRSGAPRRPTRAGAAAWLGGGAIGAAVFALYCPNDSVLFVTIWYGLALVIAGAIGARRLAW